MKCPSCNQRKGKRPCPGLNQTICSACCGQKRLIEIPCPSDCAYLISGNEYQGSRHYGKQFRGPNRALFAEVLSGKHELLMSIQEVLAHFRRIARSFDDSQALEAVTKVRETFESEQKGVIYERRSPSPEIQLVIEDLTKRVALLRRGEDGRREAAKLSDIIVCLQFLEKDIDSMAEESDSPHAYVDFITRFFPSQESTESKIILP